MTNPVFTELVQPRGRGQQQGYAGTHIHTFEADDMLDMNEGGAVNSDNSEHLSPLLHQRGAQFMLLPRRNRPNP